VPSFSSADVLEMGDSLRGEESGVKDGAVHASDRQSCRLVIDTDRFSLQAHVVSNPESERNKASLPGYCQKKSSVAYKTSCLCRHSLA
jgi:hypothetical protein